MGIPYRRDVSLIGLLDLNPNIVLADDFEGSLNWVNEASGNGTAALSASHAYRGKNALVCISDPVTPTFGDQCGVSKDFLIKPSGKHTLFCTFALNQTQYKFYFEIKVNFYINEQMYTVSVFYDSIAKTLGVLKEDNSLHDLTAYSNFIERDHWHSLTLVFNSNTLKYESLTFLNQTFDLTDVQFYQLAAPADGDRGEITILAFLGTAANQIVTMKLDDIAIIRS